MLAERVGIKKLMLIDINQKFLDIAKDSQIDSEVLDAICDDVLNVKLEQKFDLVLSIFAYHHVPDFEKQKYVSQVKSALKPGGAVVIAEIFFDSPELVVPYYDRVMKAVPEEKMTFVFKEFLEQTARSTDFEFKVPKHFVDRQFQEFGFKKIIEEKIWPMENSEYDNGTFVQLYRLPF